MVALNIYMRLPFGQFDKNNPVVCSVAEKIRRSPSSLAMKLCNFASLDPVQQARGVIGLTGCSNLDRAVWAESNRDINDLVNRSEEILRGLFDVGGEATLEVSAKYGVRVRRKTSTAPDGGEPTSPMRQVMSETVFRDAVLNNYGEQCAVTRVAVRELLEVVLVAPFPDETTKRFTLENGICLSRLHGAAFQAGLICFDDDLCVRLSNRLKQSCDRNLLIEKTFCEIEGRPLYVPKGAVAPSAAGLAEHRGRVFMA